MLNKLFFYRMQMMMTVDLNGALMHWAITLKSRA